MKKIIKIVIFCVATLLFIVMIPFFVTVCNSALGAQ
jgi:hypothetical protein